MIAAILAGIFDLFKEQYRARDRDVQDEKIKTGFTPIRAFTPILDNFTMGNPDIVANYLRLQLAIEFKMYLMEFLLSQDAKVISTRKSKAY